MVSLPNLIVRVNTLAASSRQTVSLIERLQQLANPSASIDVEIYDPEARIEIASDIQQALKDQQEELEILKLDVQDILPPAPVETSTPSSRWVSGSAGNTASRRRDGERDSEKERLVAQVSKLSEDLKSARQSFRRAQLAAKRYADAEKARERAELFAPPTLPTPPSEQKQQGEGEGDGPARPDQTLFSGPRSRQTMNQTRSPKHLTQDDITLAASQDVTNALRRTHHLLQSTISQSQFAAETLAESSAALSTLTESYSTLDSVLASSKSLVGSLMNSQKSDTWYLETAFYICAATLSWLVFRRIFYGPLWWLVWFPVKWTWWFTSGLLGGVVSSPPSAVSNVRYSTATASAMTTTPVVQAPPGKSGVPTNDPAQGGWRHVNLPGKGGGWGGPARPPGEAAALANEEKQRKSGREAAAGGGAGIIDKIHEMADKVKEQMDGKDYRYVDVGTSAGGDGQGEGPGSGTEAIDAKNAPNTKKRMWEEPPATADAGSVAGAGAVRDEL